MYTDYSTAFEVQPLSNAAVLDTKESQLMALEFLFNSSQLFSAREDEYRKGGQFHSAGIALMVAMSLGVVTVLARWAAIERFVANRTSRPGICIQCGYARVGIESDRPCPECGNRWFKPRSPGH